MVLACLAAAPDARAAQVPGGPITHGDRAQPYVALTFDACQRPGRPTGYDAALVEVLTRTQTPATFFLGGLWMQSHPTATRTLAAQPLFEIGLHSWSHANFRALGHASIAAEITRTQAVLYELTGRPATLFRFPYGSYNQRALDDVSAQGLLAIGWDVVSADPVRSYDAGRLTRNVLEHVQNGSIIIMHVNGRGWHTAEALPGIIAELRARGYVLVTVTQLLSANGAPGSGQDAANVRLWQLTGNRRAGLRCLPLLAC